MIDNLGFLKYDRKNNPAEDPKKRVEKYDEFHTPLTDEERMLQAVRCMNCGIPFCGAGIAIKGITVGCPLNNFIPEWNKMLKQGLFKEAYERLAMTSPFPEFTSRVCPALCEVACTSNINGEPVTIRENELFIIEKAFESGWVTPVEIKNRTKFKIAVIGSGPAGLAVANDLNRLGHNVTVYEKSDRFGGLLMYGIPNMKLEKNVIDRRVDLLKKEGINFVSNFDATKNHEKLSKEYDIIVLATGTGEPRDLKIKNRGLDNIILAVDYLTLSTKAYLDGVNSELAKDKDVIVIGGGDTGNDCVGTALRQKAKSVVQFEIMNEPPKTRLTSNQWPEWPMILKVDYGAEESIAIQGHDQRVFAISSKEFLGDDKIEGIKTTEVNWVKEDGKMVVKEKDGSEKEYKADLVILAMGFLGTKKELFDAFGLESDVRSNIKTVNYHTSNAKVFACGDAKSGQSLVVKAIADGKSCAQSVNDYLINK